MDLLFFYFLELNKFLTILLTLLPLFLIIFFLSTLSIFKAKFDNLVIFNIKINNVTILLKL